MSATDRITGLRENLTVTGIDFIFISASQVNLDIYFYEFNIPAPPASPVLIKTLLSDLSATDIRIYNEEGTIPDIEVLSVSWSADNVLSAVLKNPGDFTLYKIIINDRKLAGDPYRIDPYYNDVSFSFKANCPSDLDCKEPEHECPPEELIDFPINYLARDFWSYRRSLLDFASLRYPDWADRLEADAGVMMAELLSALGDEMSYYQDRVSREAYLETATQRRSIRRHARLVDYHMHDGLGATGWLDFTIDAGVLPLPAGTNVFSLSDDNTRIDFEVGKGIDEIYLSKTYTVSAANNEFAPHLWDEDDTCLLVGSTELYIEGHQKANLAFDDLPTDGQPGKWVLLKTNPTDAAQPQLSQLVRLITVTNTTDPVFNKNITHLVWEDEQALKNEFDLTILSVRGNIVPATAGKTYGAYFIVEVSLNTLTTAELNAFSGLPAGETVNRAGHDGSDIHLFTLPHSSTVPMVYLEDEDETHQYNLPEIVLEEVVYDTTTSSWMPKPFTEPWVYTNALVGVNSSKPTDKHFTLDDGSWQRVVGYQRTGAEFVHRDYAMNNGITIRFGDGEFGRIPDKGKVFRVRYRLGGTRRSNVATDTLKNIDPKISGVGVTNPLPSSGGLDAETPAELRQLATDAFKAVTYRAVRPEDYAEAAERLPWVQKAGSAFRWTGSWLTAFVTPDPKDTVYLEAEKSIDVTNQLNRFRQSGREINVMDPVYASIDLEIEICVSNDAYPGEVKERVYNALMGKKGLRPQEGYFSPDRFTFGTFLERSTLEAAIQDVPGVKAIEKIYFRRRGWFGKRLFSELSYDPGKNTIIRIANNPLHPEQGTLKLYTHGGL
ncbi:MAG: hypothetical protein IPL67_00925 [Ignavibacteria bacterium]|nr:hypothetical protein [Ignavibacteria bacterium]